MATRDRTALFLRYREEARALHRRPSVPHDDASQATTFALDEPFEAHDAHTNVEGASARRIRHGGMEPEWVFAYNDLKADLSEMEKMLEQLASLYAKHLLPSFGELDTSDLEHEIRMRSHRLTELLHTVEHKVKNLSKRRQPNQQKGRDVEGEILRNMQKRFASSLQELSVSFRKKQTAYLDKLKDQRESYSDSRASASSVPVDDINPNSKSFDDSADPGFSETQLLMVESASALAEERTQELSRVASNINDLATLVKDIASLVVDQGTVLDRIDYNLEDVKETTFAAVRELRIADRYQRKRHALCCIIILSVACGIMFIILIYKWTS